MIIKTMSEYCYNNISSFSYTFFWVMVCCQPGWSCMLVSSCSYHEGGLMLWNLELVYVVIQWSCRIAALLGYHFAPLAGSLMIEACFKGILTKFLGEKKLHTWLFKQESCHLNK